MLTTAKIDKSKMPLPMRMRIAAHKVRRCITRYIWWPLMHISQVVHPVPLLSGLVILALLGFVGQMHEIYLAYLGSSDDWHVWHIVAAAAALALLSAALYFANYSLSDVTIDVVWSEQRDLDRDSRLRAFRNLAGFAVAMLPWVGVGFGLWSAGSTADENIESLAAAARMLGAPLEGATSDLQPLKLVLHGLYVPLFVVVAVGVAVAAALHAFRRSQSIRCSALGLVALLFIAAIAVPIFIGAAERMPAGVKGFRAVGPLAMIVLDVVLVFSCVAVVTLLSRAVGIPLVTLVVAIALVAMWFELRVPGIALLVAALCATVAVLALLSARWQLLVLAGLVLGLSAGFLVPKHYADKKGLPGLPDLDLAAAYGDWLKKREPFRAAYKASQKTPYPVFIIAAEGGGIYAAAAAASFLSRLQERCPSFAQHVFAISGVSGGSVGAAVFQSAVRDQPLTATGCEGGARRTPRRVPQRAGAAIRKDHLSPLLGFMVADMLGMSDRASGLEQSLIQSAVGMDRLFDQHWSSSEAAPALVLNATWVENGYRVAFAPFTLQAPADKTRGVSTERARAPVDTTLHSFRDSHFSDPKLRSMSLAGAAVVSARFPAILPAFIVRKDDKYWNFVDGGYRDASGSLTALSIFNAIKAQSPPDVRPRLILLTNKRPQFNPKNIDGTSASDLLGPLIALLRVRDRLAEDAVIRTMAQLYGAEIAGEGTSDPDEGSDDWNVKLVETDQETFNLSLGWRISNLTYRIVSVQMGDPDICTKENREKKPPSTSTNTSIWVPTLLANSCVMQSIVRLLDPRTKVATK
jgi:hypothetical protein